MRIGNGAATQTQLDIYGELIDAIAICSQRMPDMRPLRPGLWRIITTLADEAARRWVEPDQGLWEMRGRPRHFLASKLMCWVAVDRALWLAARDRLPGPTARWEQARIAIRQAILHAGYDRDLGAFTQSFDIRALDASALLLPLVGFLPASDPRMRSTVARIEERLTEQGLVFRYRGDDGLQGREATFALCTFWLVEHLGLAGRIDEAWRLFERVTRYANDVGLLSEGIDSSTGELLGNYPQGFTHLALIRSAVQLAAAAPRASR